MMNNMVDMEESMGGLNSNNIFTFTGNIGAMSNHTPPTLRLLDDKPPLPPPFNRSRSLPTTPSNHLKRMPRIVQVPSSPVFLGIEAPPSPAAKAVLAKPIMNANIRKKHGNRHPRNNNNIIPANTRIFGSASVAIDLSNTNDQDMDYNNDGIFATIDLPSCQITNADLYHLWQTNQQTSHRIPMIPQSNGKEINVGALIDAVNRYGGIKYVRNHKLWGRVVQVATGMNLSATQEYRNFLNKVKRFYAKHIVDMEQQGMIPASTIAANMDTQGWKKRKKNI